MRTFGGDVSHWEGPIHWLLGVDYLPFIYYKATDGLFFVDDQFQNNKVGCNVVGIPHAPYHWWQETEDPVAQAEHFVDTVGEGYNRLIVDVEPKVYVNNALYKLNLLLNRITQLTGIIPAIYTSAYYWDSFIREDYPNEHPLLVAHYTYASEPHLPIGATSWKIWQFTDMFWFSGCDATADGNWFNGTLQECRDWFGNYHPYELPPQPVSFKMKVICEGLYVRQGPGIAYGIVGHLHRDEQVELKNIGGASAWMQIQSGKYAGSWCAVQTGQRWMEPS